MVDDIVRRIDPLDIPPDGAGSVHDFLVIVEEQGPLVRPDREARIYRLEEPRVVFR